MLGFATFLRARLAVAVEETRHAYEAFSGNHLIVIGLMVMVQYIVNSGLASIYEALKSDQPLWRTWRTHYLWTSITYVAGASGAALTAKFMNSAGLFTVIITTPIIGIIIYLRPYLKNIKTG